MNGAQRLRDVLDGMTIRRPQGATAAERFRNEHGLTEAEHMSIVRGEGIRRPRGPIVVPSAPSPAVDGRIGLSLEAIELFDLAQKAGGVLRLWDLRRHADVEALKRLVDELAHFGLAEHAVLPTGRSASQRAAVRVADGYEHAVVGSAAHWSRWRP